LGANPIRKPVAVGMFYPEDPVRLRAEVSELLDTSGITPAPDCVASIIVPHAGYRYSGPTAGTAYKRCEGKKPTRVVLLGCSHHHGFETASVCTAGAFECPIGTFPIDEAFAKSFADAADAVAGDAHGPEHALEVQLPFLEVTLGEVPIVPILFGSTARPWHEEIAHTLAEMLEPDDLVVCSTDLSHYLTDSEANEIDHRSLNAVLSHDVSAYNEGIAAGTSAMCGATAVATTMCQAEDRGATNWTLLDYRTSASASGDRRRVVGYGSISMETPS
jgi:AmmeMemoRadiSam system protein B